MKAAYDKAGLKSTFQIVEGAGHGGPQYRDTKRKKLILDMFEHAFHSSITRFTGRFSAFRLAAKANSRTSPRNVEAQSPADQSENRQPQNRMRGDLYAKSFRVSLAVLRSCLHDPREFQSSPTLDLIPWRHEIHHLPPSNAW